MNGKVTYHQQVSYCGKPRCRKCREGTGHGPYWYAYQTVEGRTTRTYIGKHLPPDVQAEMEGPREPAVHAKDLERSTIRIYVLGQFRLERRDPHDPLDWQTVTESAWQHQRVRSLLGSLVSVSGRKVAREQLMDALWPDLDMETAASRLDRAVYSLRQLFEPGRNRLATSPLLLTEREVLVLAEHPQIWIDADAFEHLLLQAHASEDPGEKERLLDEASTLYGGDFLPEERKNEWTLARRSALQRSWIGLLLDLADLRIERESLNSAIEPLDRLLSVDPTNEAAVQRLISLLAQLGRRGEALRAYKRLAAVLQQEYRIAPLPETRALYEAVRTGTDSRRISTPLTSGAAAFKEQEARARNSSTTSNEVAAVQIGRSFQSLLVGREQELQTLHTMVTTTEHETRFRLAAQKRTTFSALDTQRRPQCALLLGDVGIGKTRLAEEMSREARRKGWAIAWSRVYAQEGSIPYRLWTEVLRKAMAQGAWQRQEISKRPLVFQPLCTLLPELQNLLPQVSYPSSLPPEQEQLRLWEAARELLTIISDGTPLLIALDDLQWSDGGSCELLAYLARRIQGHPIVIAATCRENELPPGHPLRPLLTDLQRENAIESISLFPMSDEQITSLVSQVPHLPEPIVEGIRTRAAGNPFFAEELARTTGTQLVSEGRADTITAEELDSQMPDTITAVLDLRLARLTPPCQRLLSKAAVLGSSFQFQVINGMEAMMPGSNEDIVLDLLEEALKSGMLTEEGIGTNITYHFWHPLLEKHLYEGLSAARRASLHRRAAEIFRGIYKNREEEGAATITNHLIPGGADAQQILYYAELAGDHAYKLPSYPEAEKYYRIALDNLRESWTRNTDDDKQEHLAYFLEYLGECTRIQGKYDEARHFYEQALEVRVKLQHSFSSEEDKQEAQIQALLWQEIGQTWYDVGENTKALECYKRGEQILQEAGIVGGTTWATIRYHQGHARWREGSYEDARHIAHEALKLFEDALDQQKQKGIMPSRSTHIRRTLAGDPADLGRTHLLLGTIEVTGGRCVDGLPHHTMALALFEQYDRQREIAISSCNLGDLYLRNAEYSQAQAIFRRSLNIAEKIGDLPLFSFVIGNLGILSTHLGDLINAENEFRKGITLVEHINDPVTVSMWYAYFAVTLLEQGKIAEARAALYKAITLGRSRHITPYVGLALTVLGSMRIVQAKSINMEESSSVEKIKEKTRMLKHAKSTLQHALSLESLEVETKTEGQLTLAQAELQLGEVENALDLANHALRDAIRFELPWLVALTHRVLGDIFVSKQEYESARTYFDRASSAFRRKGMRLEYARTLHHYGELLLGRYEPETKDYQKGLNYLQEARKIFTECNAGLDLQIIARILSRYEQVSQP